MKLSSKDLSERFGEPISKQIATVGAADNGPQGKALWNDEPKKDRPWSDPTVIEEDCTCNQCGTMRTFEGEAECSCESELPASLEEAVKAQTAPQLMKQIVDVLRGIGYKAYSRERNQGAIKTWLKGPPQSPEQAEVVFKTLNAAGLNVRKHESRGAWDVSSETKLFNDKFEVKIPNSPEAARSGMGSNVAAFVSVYAGKYADDERHGMDTGDLPESLERALVKEMRPDDFDNFDRTGSEDAPRKSTTKEEIAQVVTSWYKKHNGQVDDPETGNKTPLKEIVQYVAWFMLGDKGPWWIDGSVDPVGSQWQIEERLKENYLFWQELAGDLYDLISLDELDEKAPPGYEKIVKGLKKDKNVDNPWAVAWSMKNKGIGPR